MLVLILVVMEDSLGPIEKSWLKATKEPVLILVVMEDSLGRVHLEIVGIDTPTS